MSKSGRQKNKKQRDKRHSRMRLASCVPNWESLDVSGWFDDSVCFEQNDLERIHPDAKYLSFPVYKDVLPGEFYFSYYAHAHPDKEDEIVAVGLIKHWRSCYADDDAEENTVAPWKPVLCELRALAKKGCVTANSFLGYLYKDGIGVHKNTTTAKRYLSLATASDEPCACYLLWTILPEDEGLDLLQKSMKYGCPQAIYQRIYQTPVDELDLTNAELDIIAAMATRGSWKCLAAILDFLKSDCGKHMRDVYAPAMLRLLKKLACAGFSEATQTQGVFCMNGILLPEDMREADRWLKKAWELGSENGAGFYARCLLMQTENPFMTPDAKESRRRLAREVVEEEVRVRNSDVVAMGVLGSMLVMSDNDAEFERGTGYLEESIAMECIGMPLQAIQCTLDWSANPERHRKVLKMLNTMVRQGYREAFYERGRYYMHGGIVRNYDQKRGLKLLHEAADLDVGEACLLLGEIYLFGLFQVAQDIKKGMEMLQKGMALGNKGCIILYALIEINEIPVLSAVSKEDVLSGCTRLLTENDDRNNYVHTVYNQIITGADNALMKYGVADKILPKTRDDYRMFAKAFASRCMLCMMQCDFGPFVYMTKALRNIGQTKFAGLYAEALAVALHFEPGISCDGIADKFENLLFGLPSSAGRFRLMYGDELREKYVPSF